MKKLLSIAAGLLIAVHGFATGVAPINTAQNGFLYFTTNSPAYTAITNAFAPGFSALPVMSFYLISGPTNATPLTNVFVTTTNFAVQIATSTNATVAWTAIQGSPRMQFGTNAITGGASVTNVFSAPYAYLPTVNVEGSTTNGIGITSVSATGFIITSAVTQSVYWNAIGVCATPGTANITY